MITGDHTLYIYGCYMKERGKLLTNTVVTTVMSNFLSARPCRRRKMSTPDGEIVH